jgi:DNA-binding IclR family transcriptional regulator
MRELKTPSVTGLERGLKLLEMLGNVKVRRTLPILAAQSSLPKSSVHSLLLTFERQGYICRHRKTGEYMFAPKLLRLANTSATGLGLREIAAPHLQNLANRMRISTDLGVMENHQVWIIAKYALGGFFGGSPGMGARMPMHCTAIGKALLARLNDEELHAFTAVQGLARYNDNTLASEKKLKADLANSRVRGYTIEDEECELGTRGVGAAVLDHEQRPIAAISLVGSIHQITGENLSVLAKGVMETAAAISRAVQLTVSLPPETAGELAPQQEEM